MMRTKAAVLSALLMACGACWAQPPHARVVNPAAPSHGNGVSWSAPYATLQQALDAALANSGITEIWLAAGEYVPTRPQSPGIEASRTFVLKDNLAIYGGFAGHEQTLAGRNPRLHITRLTGESLAIRPHAIVTAQGVGRSAVLDGLTITGGAANGEQGQGGGVKILSASPTIRDCQIVGNRGLSGGGVWIHGGAPLFVSARIADNIATSAGAGGGGVLITAGQPSFIRCTLEGNICQGPSSGGGIAMQNGNLTLRHCRLLGNFADAGGALAASGGSSTLANCLISGNGDGIVGQNLNLLSCTIIDNIPAQPMASGGVNGTGTMVGCIVWGNVEPALHGQLPQVQGGIQARYSCIAPHTPLPFAPALAGAGLIHKDPRLDAQGRLLAGSPCIDAGDSSALPAWLTTDLADNPRRVDDPNTPDTGIGPAPVVDIGAFEYAAAVTAAACYANCDGSTASPQLNAADFACFLDRFVAGDPWANCDGSGGQPLLTILDLHCFMSRFLEGCQ